MIIRFLFVVFTVASLASCATTNYGVYNNVLDKKDISSDINFIKRKLITQHYSLNWEGRQVKVFQALDSLAQVSEKLTVKRFKNSLKPILAFVDDGHTDVMSEIELDLRKAKSSKPFNCLLLEKNTVYLKVPHFVDPAALNKALDTFDHFLTAHEAERVVIDLRSNPGGSVNLVRQFLSRILESPTQYCLGQKTKMVSGLHLSRKLILLLRGKKSQESKVYILSEEQQVQSFNDYEVAHKYVLVDSTMISGSMIAAYHLREDGYKVIGSAPTALFNSFMNPIFFNLPKSKLYLAISTGRFHLDENLNNRADDQLQPDFETKLDFSLKGLMNGIRQIEALP